MRIPFQLILLGLGIAATTLILEGAKRAMSGKHKRSPNSGDSPSAKEARLAQEMDPAPSGDSKPTDKEVAAAEAARARLDGDQTIAASVRSFALAFKVKPCAICIAGLLRRHQRASCLTAPSLQ